MEDAEEENRGHTTKHMQEIIESFQFILSVSLIGGEEKSNFIIIKPLMIRRP